MAHDQRPQKARRVRPPSLILASASPRRRALMRALGLPYRVVEPRIEEVADGFSTPATLVRYNATLKANAVAARQHRGIVIAADTVVALGARIFGKPRHPADAAAMLRQLDGRTHRVYTGVCVIDVARRRRSLDVVVSRVRLRRLTPTQIATYLAHHRPWDKAGAYAVQDVERLIIDEVHGSLSNVIGLPLDVLQHRLRQFGVAV